MMISESEVEALVGKKAVFLIQISSFTYSKPFLACSVKLGRGQRHNLYPYAIFSTGNKKRKIPLANIFSIEILSTEKILGIINEKDQRMEELEKLIEKINALTEI